VDDRHNTSAIWDAAQFRAILEAAPDAMLVVDELGRIVLVNSRAEHLFGFQRSAILGERVETLIPSRLRNAHLHARDEYQRAPRVRPMGAGLLLFGLRADGTEFPVEISLSPVQTPQGSLVIAAIRDVSHAEQRTQFALRAAHMGVWEFEISTGRVTWSPAMAAVFGLKATEAPTTYDEFLGLIHEDDRATLQDSVARAMQGDEYEIEFRTTKPSGALTWVAGRARLLRDTSGKPERLVGVGMDITERKVLEAQLAAGMEERLQAEARIAEQRLRVLKATMRTVQDIVSNALNGSAHFRAEAENVLSSESLRLLDELVTDTTARIRMLGNLESTPETDRAIGVGIDYLGATPPRKP
jgi:PAS domain S-box-containing protein